MKRMIRIILFLSILLSGISANAQNGGIPDTSRVEGFINECGPDTMHDQSTDWLAMNKKMMCLAFFTGAGQMLVVYQDANKSWYNINPRICPPSYPNGTFLDIIHVRMKKMLFEKRIRSNNTTSMGIIAAMLEEWPCK